MAPQSSPKSVSAERVKGGVVITFNNGDEGFYSDERLYACLGDAQKQLSRMLDQIEDSEPPVSLD